MKIYVVNMDKRTDRWAYISKQLDELSIKYERFSAVVGIDLSLEEQKLFNEKKFILEQKKPHALGEIGCAMSHRKIWQKVLDENLDYALIIEDDVHLEPKLLDFLSKKENYNQFDMLNLSSTEPYRLEGVKDLKLATGESIKRPSLWDFKSRKEWTLMEWRRRWRIFSIKRIFDDLYTMECDPAPALTSGYIVSNKGAKFLLETSQEMFYPIDLTWRYTHGELVEGFLSESLIKQALDETDIHGRYNGYKLNLWQRVQRMFVKSRRIRRRLDVAKMYGWSKL